MKILRILASFALGIFLIAATTYQFAYSGAQVKAFYDWLNTVTATISTTEALLLDGHTALQEEPLEGAFVDGDKSKLNGIESNATADQTGAEIKSAYEAEEDTNAYTDAEKSLVESAVQPEDIEGLGFLTGVTQQVFGAADTDPDVTNGGAAVVHYWATGGVVTITDLDDGDDHSEFSDGDWLYLVCDHAITLDLSDNSNMYGHNNEDWTASVGDTVLFVWDVTNAAWLAMVSSIKTIPDMSLRDSTATDGMILKYDKSSDDRYESVDDEFTECIYIKDPTADDDLQSIFANKTSRDFLLTAIWAESDQTVNFDLQIDDGTPADVNGTDISPAAGEAEDTSLSGDTTLAAGEELDLVVTSVSGTPTWVSICWTYERK
jgi:hypothetical protein